MFLSWGVFVIALLAVTIAFPGPPEPNSNPCFPFPDFLVLLINNSLSFVFASRSFSFLCLFNPADDPEFSESHPFLSL